MVVLTAPCSLAYRFWLLGIRYEVCLSFNLLNGRRVAGFRQIAPTRKGWQGWNGSWKIVDVHLGIIRILLPNLPGLVEFVAFHRMWMKKTVISQKQLADIDAGDDTDDEDYEDSDSEMGDDTDVEEDSWVIW